MGIIKKALIIFLLCNVLVVANEMEEVTENEVPISEAIEEEEVLTGKSLFYENSELIRIEMRENNIGKFGAEKSKNQSEDKEVGDTREDFDSERENTTTKDSEKSEENKS